MTISKLRREHRLRLYEGLIDAEIQLADQIKELFPEQTFFNMDLGLITGWLRLRGPNKFYAEWVKKIPELDTKLGQVLDQDILDMDIRFRFGNWATSPNDEDQELEITITFTHD